MEDEHDFHLVHDSEDEVRREIHNIYTYVHHATSSHMHKDTGTTRHTRRSHRMKKEHRVVWVGKLFVYSLNRH